MTFRTPNPFSNTRATLDLQRVKEHMAVLSQQISSGKRIVRLGDDPTGSALIVDLRNSISRNDQYMRQIDSAAEFLRSTETSLTGVSDSLMRVMEMTTQALGSATTDAMRGAMVAEARGILTQMVSLANQQDQGKFLFAGTQTTLPPNTLPFALVAGPPASTTYSGDANEIVLDVSLGATVTTNLPGEMVFYGTGGQGSSTDLFQQLSQLIEGLGPPSNMPQIQSAATNINSIFAGIQQQIAEVGGRQASLAQVRTTLDNFSASLQSIQENYESVDYPAAVTEYESESIVQQAALSMLAKNNSQNLFNFLG